MVCPLLPARVRDFCGGSPVLLAKHDLPSSSRFYMKKK